MIKQIQKSKEVQKVFNLYSEKGLETYKRVPTFESAKEYLLHEDIRNFEIIMLLSTMANASRRYEDLLLSIAGKKPYEYVKKRRYSKIKNSNIAVSDIYTLHDVYIVMKNINQIFRVWGTIGEYLKRSKLYPCDAIATIFCATTKLRNKVNSMYHINLLLKYMGAFGKYDYGIWEEALEGKTLFLPLTKKMVNACIEHKLIPKCGDTSRATVQVLTDTMSDMFNGDIAKGYYSLIYAINKDCPYYFDRVNYDYKVEDSMWNKLNKK